VKTRFRSLTFSKWVFNLYRYSAAAFGAGGRAFITFVLYTELIGTCALFFILEGDHLAILFGNAHSSQWFMAASAAVMIPTLWWGCTS
jgi:hypothetical protein